MCPSRRRCFSSATWRRPIIRTPGSGTCRPSCGAAMARCSAGTLPRGRALDERTQRHLELLGRDFYGALGVAEGLIRHPQGYSVGEVSRFLERARELMPADAPKDERARFFHLRGAMRAGMGDKAGAQRDFEAALSVWPARDQPGGPGPGSAAPAVVRAAALPGFRRPVRAVDARRRQGRQLGPAELPLLRALAAARGRLAQDFFAASAQSYLNPVGYLPFYLMVSSGWHSLLASSVLAALHSLNLALLYFIARRVFAHLPPREQTLFACLGTALGAATWVFWPTVGSSFLDPLLLPLILGGLLVFGGWETRPAGRCALRRGGGAQVLERHLRPRSAAAGAHPARESRVRRGSRARRSPCSRVRLAGHAGLAARVRQSGLPAHERMVRVAARAAGQPGERAIHAARLPRGARDPVPHGGARPPPVLGDLRPGPAPCAAHACRNRRCPWRRKPLTTVDRRMLHLSRPGRRAVDHELRQCALRPAGAAARRAGARAPRRAPAAAACGAHRARDAARGAGGNLTDGCADALVPRRALVGALAAV